MHYLHFILEGVDGAVHAQIPFHFTQYNAFPEDKHLSLMSSGGCPHLCGVLPHCEDSLGKIKQFQFKSV